MLTGCGRGSDLKPLFTWPLILGMTQTFHFYFFALFLSWSRWNKWKHLDKEMFCLPALLPALTQCWCSALVLFFFSAGLWRSTAGGSKVRWPVRARAPTVESRPLVWSNPVLFDLQFRRGWPNRSPWPSLRPCSPPGWVWSSRPRTCSLLPGWSCSPPVALPSYPPADWLLCFWSDRIVLLLLATLFSCVVPDWLTSLPCFVEDTHLPLALFLFAFLLLLVFLFTFFFVILCFNFLLL